MSGTYCTEGQGQGLQDVQHGPQHSPTPQQVRETREGWKEGKMEEGKREKKEGEVKEKDRYIEMQQEGKVEKGAVRTKKEREGERLIE